jgi:hypothetical protein
VNPAADLAPVWVELFALRIYAIGEIKLASILWKTPQSSPAGLRIILVGI